MYDFIGVVDSAVPFHHFSTKNRKKKKNEIITFAAKAKENVCSGFSSFDQTFHSNVREIKESTFVADPSIVYKSIT